MEKEEKKLLADLKRTTWLPQVTPGEQKEIASKFGGVPWLETGEKIPHCPRCDREFQLLLQLDLSTLPHDAFGAGSEELFQFFFCISEEPLCMVEGKSWEAFSEVALVRSVPRPKNIEIPKRKTISEFNYPTHEEQEILAYPAKTILGWTPHEDYPGYSEREVLGRWKEEYFDEDPLKGFPVEGEKLGGWAYWVQWVNYPNCPRCKEKMSFFFQIDSNKILPHQWGDLGCGYLTRCATHEKEFAFSWSSG